MKLLKWVLIAAGAVIILVAVVLAFIVATFEPNQYKAQLAALVKDKTQRTLTIEGNVRLMLFPKLGVHLGKTRFSEFNSQKEFARLEDMRVSLAVLPLLTKQIVVDEILLDGLRADLVKYKDGKTNFADLLGGAKAETAESGQHESAKAQSAIKFDIDGVRISKARLNWNDEATGAKYTISDFNLTTGRIAPGVPSKIALSAAIGGSEPKLDVSLRAEGVLDADLEKQKLSMTGLSVELNDNSSAVKRVAHLSGSWAADLKMQVASADLAAKVGTSNIKAKFSLEDFTLLRTRFDVTIDKLNVDEHLPPKTASSNAGAPAAAPSEQPINFAPLKKLDLDGKVQIGALLASNINAQNIRLELRAKNGKMVVDPFNADLYQGRADGVISVDANTNRIAVKQNLVNISIGPLLHDATGRDLLEGHGKVALDLMSNGNTVSSIKRALEGTARLELRDGAIQGIDIAKSLSSAKALLTSGKPQAEQSAAIAAGDKTAFSELTASFLIKNGIAHNSDLIVKSPFLRLTGDGDINLPDGSINYLAKASVVATSAGQGGDEMADLRGLTVPVRVSGPFAVLKYKLEFGSLVSDSAKQKFQQKKDAIKSKLEDQLRSKLLGKPSEPDAPGRTAEQPAGQAPPAPPKAEDKLKEKLKKLF